MPLKIVQRSAEDVVILDLAGRLWILDLPLRDLTGSLLLDGKKYFVVNLAGVDYVDSSGLGQLVSMWTSIRNKGGHLAILSPTKRVEKLLEITRLDTVFTIVHAEDEAVRKARTASA
ncbi:MAG TPA: STAS domain-containing protein [Terriglobia bacterium]|jgi:anti-sigma B factor antagonist